MKTLSQVEPRTVIGSLPFVITNSGSYYLTASLTGTSGQAGISVQANNVTLDLNGFTLSGVAGSLQGIVASNVQGLVVYNGTISGWAGTGLDASTAFNCRIERLIASGNGSHGVSVASGSVISDCVASANGGDGIKIGSSCNVLNNLSQTNGAAGIEATGTGNRIEGNSVVGNSGNGILVEGIANLIIKNSGAYNVGTDYNIASGSSYGQLVLGAGPGFTNATAWANFSSTCPGTQTFCSGVCTQLSSDVNNCGACGSACSFANGSGACTGGSCQLSACNSGYANCDGNPTNGCEVNTNTSLSNCGACGALCALPNATPTCISGGCVIASCNAGYANCNGNSASGCNINVESDPNNCGFCAHVCVIPNGAAACVSGSCVIASCNSGYANCDGNVANGCEANLNTSNTTCGNCGTACNTTTSTCTAGKCLLISGQTCTSASQCASDVCTSGKCVGT